LLISVHSVQIHKIVLVMYAHDTLRSISHCLMPDGWEECSNLACVWGQIRREECSNLACVQMQIGQIRIRIPVFAANGSS
jgi:hypothetical protein